MRLTQDACRQRGAPLKTCLSLHFRSIADHSENNHVQHERNEKSTWINHKRKIVIYCPRLRILDWG